MEDTATATISEYIDAQRTYFASGATKEIQFRLAQLKRFKAAVQRYEKEIQQALWDDLHKSPEEAYLTEISILTQEIDYHIRNLKAWAKPEKVPTPLHLQPSSGEIVFEPLGCVLIMAPWNYPFQLLMNPLVGAISAGCCSLLKPSPDTPAISKVMDTLVRETFDPRHVAIVHGGLENSKFLLTQRFDQICFTGSSAVGKIVMKAAAEYLTPVLLELGGKSPCIVDESANLKIAAKRITWGKLINAGQTCIAPDYLLVHTAVKEALLQQIIVQIRALYGDQIRDSRFYPRIVSQRALDRLKGLMESGRVYYGGELDEAEKFIAPTILEVQPDDAIMQEEIFGPVLPVMTFEKLDEAVNYINSQEKPLALYYFGNARKGDEVVAKTSSGGVCINDTLMHIANHHLPFGGVGNSGLGKYHGHRSFLAFSNERAVISTPVAIDLPFKYPPFKYFNWIKRILG